MVGGGITQFDYQVDPTSGHVSAHGRWASKAFDLIVDEGVITVNSRYCTDTYRRRGADSDVFVGATGCYQTGLYGTYLVVPKSFFKRPAGEQVVFRNAFLM